MLSVRNLLPLPFLLLVACSQPIPAASSVPTSDGSSSLLSARIQTLAAPTKTNSITPSSALPAPAVETLSAAKGFSQTKSPESLPSPVSQPLLQEEAILILSPGPGSRVTNPVHVSGMVDPAFEQTLAVRLVAEDGSILSSAPAHIEAAPGERGQFNVDLRVETDKKTQSVLQVYASNPRDGGVTHLSSAAVTFAPSGAQNILPVPSQLERIIISQPTSGALLSNGVVHIEGFGLASFEQTLLVEVIGPDGMTAGKQPLIVNAPDIGKPGSFQADVTYQISAAGPGRILVHDPIPAGTGIAHSSSIEVNLTP